MTVVNSHQIGRLQQVQRESGSMYVITMPLLCLSRNEQAGLVVALQSMCLKASGLDNTVILPRMLLATNGLALLSTALLLQHEFAEGCFCFAAICIRLQALRNASCLEHVAVSAPSKTISD